MRRPLIPLALIALTLAPQGMAQETDETREDRGRIVAFIEDNLSGAGRQVILRDFEGALSSRATASQLTIADDQGVWLTVNDIVLDWNRAALLTGALSVNELTAGEIIVDRAPVAQADAPAPEATGFSLPELPVSVNIGKINAARVVLGESLIGQAVEGTVSASVALNGGQGDVSLLIDRTDQGPAGQINLQASYDNETRQLAIDLAAVESADGLAVTLLGIPGQPSADLTVQGQGSLDDFVAQIALQTDGQDRLSGQAALRAGAAEGDQAFSADLSGDLAPLFVPEYQDFFGDTVALQVAGQKAATGVLDVSALSITTSSLQLDGALRLAGDGLPEQLRLTGRLANPSGAAVVLPVGSPVALDGLDLDIAYDSRQGETWTARLTGQGLDLPQVQIPAFDLAGSGRINRQANDPLFGGTLRGTVGGMVFDDARLSQAIGADLALETRFWWQRSADVFSIGNLTATGQDLALRLSGEVDGLSAGLRLNGRVQATASDLGRFSGFAGRDLAGAGEVLLTGQGSPLGGDFDVDLQVVGTDLGVGIAQVDSLLAGRSQLDLAVVRDPTGTELRRLALRSLAVSVDGSGQLDSDTAQAEITFTVPDLSVAGAGFGGSASGQASLSGPLMQGRADIAANVQAQDIQVSVPEVDRLLAGRTQIDFAGALTDAALQITRADLQGQSYAAQLSGIVSADVNDIAGSVSLADLSVIRPEYGGAVQADFTVQGTVDQAALTLNGATTDLAIGIAEVDGLLRGRTVASLTADLQGQALNIASARIEGQQVTAQVQGLLDAKGSDVTGRVELTNLATVRAGFGGAVAADFTAKGTVDAAALTLAATARDLRVGQSQANALLAGATSLDAVVRVQDGQLRIDSARLDNPQLTASAAGQVAGGAQSLELDARLVNLALLLPEFPGPVTLRGTAAEQAAGYRVDLAGTGPGQIDATIRGQIDGDFGGGDLAIAGSAQAGLANPFLGTRVLSGPIAVDLRLNGPFALSSLSGRATLSNGRMADATLPFSLTDLSADIGLNAGQADVTVSAGVSTGGSLGVRGGIGLAAPFAADLGITLSGVVVKDPQLYQTLANGQLRLAGPLTGGAVLSGRIALPETEIRIASTGLGGAGDLPGLEHRGEPAAVLETRRRAGLLEQTQDTSSTPRRPYGLDLVISAPNRLFIRGRGLDAELGGELRVAGTSDNVIPSGGFDLIRGRLEILGRRLDLSEASMQLEGSFDPFLRIVASTEADGVTANVVIEGQATDPTVSFTSSPDLPEEEVIAQILFGKRLESLSALQAVQLANAVATLAGRGGEGIVSRLRSGIGLDDLDVQTTDDGSAQLTAGKYITENVYSEVTVDQTGKSEISLNLDLTDSITVKGRVGNDGDTGLGLYYEKDY
ncbi:translocation/assembly module TamB domain-containing protein [Pseudotabrizicola sp. L79]|uniref:translocation/assembly module TamB domain-containing protein n=1 Tax=Pseudotabrizicola sp. L79 TaxID=3118402 RepID=UPI002F95F7F7